MVSSAANRMALLEAFSSVKTAVVLIKTALSMPEASAARTMFEAWPKPMEAKFTSVCTPSIAFIKDFLLFKSPEAHSNAIPESTFLLLEGLTRHRTW